MYNGIIRHKKKLTTKELQTILSDTAKCLWFLKKYGIIHCDLKPENILIKNDASYNVKVIDFGSASFLDCQEYDYLQTRPYRAPEITFGCSFDFAADVWSFGCIAYELLTGSVLFKYKTHQENFGKALSINNSVDFNMFSDGKKWGKHFNTNGLLSIVENNPTERNVYKTIIPKDDVNFKAQIASHTSSNDCIDLIRRCLILDPTRRIKIEEIIEHPFVKKT